jgi:hypothetical protein
MFHGQTSGIKTHLVQDFEQVRASMEKSIETKTSLKFDEELNPIPKNLHITELNNAKRIREQRQALEGISSDDHSLFSNPYVDLDPRNRLKINYSLAEQTVGIPRSEVSSKIDKQKADLYGRIISRRMNYNEIFGVLPPEVMQDGWLELQKPLKPPAKLSLAELKSLLQSK